MPRQEGVCTDVVIRALRNAGIDLQRAVYDDAGRAPAAYPRIGRRRNPSIDHRRVKNLIRYFDRHWQRLPVGRAACSRGTCCSWTPCRRCPTPTTWASPAIDATTWGCPG